MYCVQDWFLCRTGFRTSMHVCWHHGLPAPAHSRHRPQVPGFICSWDRRDWVKIRVGRLKGKWHTCLDCMSYTNPEHRMGVQQWVSPTEQEISIGWSRCQQVEMAAFVSSSLPVGNLDNQIMPNRFQWLPKSKHIVGTCALTHQVTTCYNSIQCECQSIHNSDPLEVIECEGSALQKPLIILCV